MTVKSIEARGTDVCPWCASEVRFKTKIYSAEYAKYIFYCRSCDLGFSYGYLYGSFESPKTLIIHALCPVCLVEHHPEVVGVCKTDQIPCEPCWKESRGRNDKA